MTEDTDPAMKRARLRARELLKLYQHVATYVGVIALLVVIDVAA